MGLPDREMRTEFTHVWSLVSVNAVKIFAGGMHSWVVLDDVMPKKDDYKGQNEISAANDDDYLLNDDDSIKPLSNMGFQQTINKDNS